MKAIINLDKVKYPDVVTAKNGADVLENGAFVALGGLVADRLGRDCYKIEKLAEGCELGFVADVALMYDETKDERDFELAAEAITRVYRAKKGQGIKASSYQLQIVTTGGVARVLEVYNFEGQDSYYIEFI